MVNYVMMLETMAVNERDVLPLSVLSSEIRTLNILRYPCTPPVDTSA